MSEYIRINGIEGGWGPFFPKLHAVFYSRPPFPDQIKSAITLARIFPILSQIKDGWDSCTNFMQSYGLKPYNVEDCEEALEISRAFKGKNILYSNHINFPFFLINIV